MPFVRASDIDFYYETHGPKIGDAPAVVFAHGAGGNHLSWWQQVPHFRKRLTCVTFDHRGFGQSHDVDGGPGGAAFVDDLQTLLDHLGIGRATLVAQSMGGWTCLGFSVRYPERVERLVMCDTHGGMTAPDIDGVWAASREQAAKLPEGVHPACGERMFREQPDRHFLYTEIAAINDITREQTWATIQAAGTIAASEAAKLSMPVMFVIGEEDIVLPPPYLEAAAAYVRGARIERVPRAGHSVYFERADIFNEVVDRFIDET